MHTAVENPRRPPVGVGLGIVDVEEGVPSLIVTVAIYFVPQQVVRPRKRSSLMGDVCWPT